MSFLDCDPNRKQVDFIYHDPGTDAAIKWMLCLVKSFDLKRAIALQVPFEDQFLSHGSFLLRIIQ